MVIGVYIWARWVSRFFLVLYLLEFGLPYLLFVLLWSIYVSTW